MSSSPTAIFELPDDHKAFVNDVISRCYDLIDADIWEGLKPGDLNRWLTNFDDDLGTYFAACLLDVLVYRSEAQTLALMRQLLQRSLPDLGRRLSAPITDWEDRFRTTTKSFNNRVCMIPVLPPSVGTKSGAIILRHFQKKLRVAEESLAKPEEVHALASAGAVDAIVFVDDFLGTGTQFEEFAVDYSLAAVPSTVSLIYAPLVAHESGVVHVNSKVPNVRVTYAEFLPKAMALFDQHGRTFDDGKNSAASAWSFYLSLLAKHGINLLGAKRGGFGGLELAYFFNHAAPDNCLPIFWWRHSNTWKPLLER